MHGALLPLAGAAVGKAVLWIAVSYAGWQILNWLLLQITGIQTAGGSVPLLGHLPALILKTVHRFHVQCSHTAPVFRQWWGMVPHIVISSPEAVKQVLTKNTFRPFHPVPVTATARSLYTEGLVWANADYHKLIRSLWLPVFHPASLAQYLPIMEQCARKLTAVCGMAADTQQYVDIWCLGGATIMEVVATCAFGMNLDVLSDWATGIDGKLNHSLQPAAVTNSHAQLGRRVVHAMRDLLEVNRPDKASAWCLPWSIVPWAKGRQWVNNLADMFPDKPHKQMGDASMELSAVAMELIQAERQHMQGSSNKTQQPQSGLIPGTFLRNMLATAGTGTQSDKGPLISDEQLAANVVTFLGAGYETTASSVGFAMYYLSEPRNHAALAMAQQEIDAFTCTHGKDAMPTYEQLFAGFPVLEACFNETLRMMPSTPFVMRQAEHDMQLAGHPGVHIRRGTSMQISFSALHRLRSVWPKPDEFLPIRFLPEGKHLAANDIQAAFMPFGGGARMCVGYKFATILAKYLLFTLLRDFTYELAPGYALKDVTGLTIVPDGGVTVKIARRSA